MKSTMDSWAASIVSQALQDIASGQRKEDVIEKVKGTALYARKDYWKQFLKLVEMREKAFGPSWRTVYNARWTDLR